MPSLFSNEYSRGPLYQYWKERGQEEKFLRGQRVDEAKLRAKGFKPLDAAYGPSSSESYASREGRGPPAYAPASTEEALAAGSRGHIPAADELPAYIDTDAGLASGSDTRSRSHSQPHEEGLVSAEEEKARLRALEEQNQRTRSDAAIARTLSDEAPDEGEDDKGKEPEARRKKSTVGKVGRWLADAASGYTKRQERW
ncbi:hypothetical protein A1O7_06832 [Cladophialophora yegresii CBS 114405]|uniref:Uncharacterized protein n=1 Tax=Cladophialophora yegresii CBS 114405 TaxID=1182544 RepID=W9VLV4_9EURO|nr:uncharacterized protein A1O7_06832 [Cladophialophora yegresii CBS 114405]EXJ56488.1 hypothetical protein A1O7_06832 [Cladophialophora yegresii CBS 114405]